MDGNLVAHHVLGDERIGVGDHARADDEERGVHVVIVEEVQNLTVGRINASQYWP